MEGYVKKACVRFKHEMPKRQQDSPHQHTIPTYGASVQYAKDEDKSELLDEKGKTLVQQVIGAFLFYA